MNTDDLEISGNVVEVPLTLIKVKEDRYRKDLGDIESLAESINTVGQLVPIIVTSDGTLIAGERRYRACQFLKKPTINAILKSPSEIDTKIFEILENLERKEFTWQEQVLAIDDLHNLFKVSNKKWSERKTAQKAGLSSGGVSTDLNLAEAIKIDPEMFKHCKTKESALKTLQKFQTDEVLTEIKLRKSKTNYGSEAKNYIFHGDCLKLIDELPSGIINAIISDPVYGIDINAVKKHHEGKNDVYEDEVEEYFKLMRVLISKIPRVLNDNATVLLFCRIENFYWLYKQLSDVGIRCDNIPGIWLRGGGQTNQPNLYMARSWEPFIYGYKGNATIIKPGLSNVLQYSGIAPSNKEHPVQKPIVLMEELIGRFCLPGHTILDIMAGSFTTGVAAIKRGCKPIGFELDEKYYTTAVTRIADALNAKDAGKLNLISDVKG